MRTALAVAVVWCTPLALFAQTSTLKHLIYDELQLSTVPTVYQSQVEPGGILAIENGNQVSYAPPSEAAKKMPSTSPSATVPGEAGADALQGQLAITLFGFEPKGKLTSQGTISFNQLELSGDGITTTSLDQLMTDPDTVKAIEGYSGKIYIIEAVYRTTSLNATSSSAISGGAGTAALADCPTDVLSPTLPPKPSMPVPAVDQPAVGVGQTGTQPAQPPPGNTTSSTPSAPSTQQKPNPNGAPTAGAALVDATKSNPALKLPWSAGVSGCRGRVGEVHLATTKPIALGMKVNEVTYAREKNRTTGMWGPWHWTYSGTQYNFR